MIIFMTTQLSRNMSPNCQRNMSAGY